MQSTPLNRTITGPILDASLRSHYLARSVERMVKIKKVSA